MFSHDGPLDQVPGAGGPLTRLTTLDAAKKELFHAWPEVLPGGKAILFVTLGGDDLKTSRIDALTLATGERHPLIPGTFPRYVSSGHLVFYRDKDLLAAPFDIRRLELTGPAVRLVENLGLDFNGTPLASVASNRLAYVPVGIGTSRLVVGVARRRRTADYRFDGPLPVAAVVARREAHRRPHGWEPLGL